MIILGIESSCDETSVAIIKDGKILCNLISSQTIHKNYGGVVPELSSRAHLQLILPLVKQALDETETKLNKINLICSTAGPGLIGALLVGFTFAKGLAFSLNIPFVPVNHVEGHIFSGFLMHDKPVFPYLCLAVSGGNTLLLVVKSDSEIIKLGSTIDDAVGEAFDKVSKLIGLGYPGGPKIQEAAKLGNPNAIKFPIARTKNEMDFSFSGLKTAVLRYVQKEYPDGTIDNLGVYDIAASFQKTAIESLLINVRKAIINNKVNSISVVGGVAANLKLREGIIEVAKRYNIKAVVPSIEYCGDNAAMIAYRGGQLDKLGLKYDFDYCAFPNMNTDNWK